MNETCHGIAYPYIDPESGHRKHVGEVPCGTTPQSCELCYTLDVRSNLGGVPIAVTPQDDFGRGNGNTDFQRVYAMNPGVTVHLVAPQTHMGLNFRHWRIDGEMPYIFNVAIDVLLDGTKCREAVAIYGEVFPFGGCGVGCGVDLPEWITISGWFTQLNVSDPSICGSCSGNSNRCNALWGANRHSALCRAGSEHFGEVGWTSGFPNGPGDPLHNSPPCELGAEGCMGGGVGFYTCPDGCFEGVPSTHYFHPCGAEFYARLKCICLTPSESTMPGLIARVAGGLGIYGTEWSPTCPAVMPSTCFQELIEPFYQCGANNEPGKDFYVARIENSIDCCNQADKVLGHYELDITGNSDPGGACNRVAIGRVSFTI